LDARKLPAATSTIKRWRLLDDSEIVAETINELTKASWQVRGHLRSRVNPKARAALSSSRQHRLVRWRALHAMWRGEWRGISSYFSCISMQARVASLLHKITLVSSLRPKMTGSE
jgi:hypothetical protein